MAKTADLQQSVWTDPWFLALNTDAKCLYLWAVTTPHGNLAGLYTVAAPVIQLETGLTPARFDAALDALEGKVAYFPATGAMWVRGKAKHTRSKTTQIARSVRKAVAACPEPVLQQAFIEKYGQSAWLKSELEDLALDMERSEPQQNLGEVPIPGSRSRSFKEVQRETSEPKASEDRNRIPDEFPGYLVPSVEATLPVLRRVAAGKKAKPVDRLPLARTIAQFPDRDHPMVAGELEHWALHGNGENRPIKDVVASFRNFLKRADRVASPQAAPATDRFSKYDKNTIEVRAA